MIGVILLVSSKDLYSYSVDYLSGVISSPFVSRFFRDLGKLDSRLKFDNFNKWSTGINFFSERYCLNDQAYITVAFNEPVPGELRPEGYFDSCDLFLASMQHHNKGIFFSVSGDGLRYLGNEVISNLFKLLLAYDFKCTRIDICCDCFDPDNEYVPLCSQMLSNLYYQVGWVPGSVGVTTNLSRNNVKRYQNFDNIRDKEFLSKFALEVAPGIYETINFTWGRKDSTKCQFRLYDKWLEVATHPRFKSISDKVLADVPQTNYWYRFEYEMHYQYAEDIFNSLAKDDANVPAAFSFCAEDCFMPVILKDGKTREACHMPSSEVWIDFLELCSFFGAEGEVCKTINFVSLKYYFVEDRIKYINDNLPLFYQCFMLCKAYPWLLDTVLTRGRDKFYNNKKNRPILYQINKEFFKTNIFARPDISDIPVEEFEQLCLDSMFEDFPRVSSL